MNKNRLLLVICTILFIVLTIVTSVHAINSNLIYFIEFVGAVLAGYCAIEVYDERKIEWASFIVKQLKFLSEEEYEYKDE